ncbi:linker for activation of T-cells family member 1-like [Centropristis striata]|uniref:linker for activation of T-cells family member 1-like n=1 Tax=Centropristis striata TaxID=184440 RepID=UPI0027DFE18F|nr:linker for activation of T-cells family member 1-like [Centropristis striata]
MAVSWLIWVLAAAIFVSTVLLAVVCLQCRSRGPLVSIRQGNSSEDYMPSDHFRVIHPSMPNSIHLPSNLLSPFSPSTDPGTQHRHRSVTPTETESNPSYENPTEGPDYINESDAEDPGYIIVLPDGETPQNNQSRASTPSSDVRNDYENVPNKKSSSEDYLNVNPLQHQTGSTPDLSAQSNSDSDDDDDEGNYVNVNEVTQTITV